MTTADGEVDKSIDKVDGPVQTGPRRVKVRLFRLRNKLKEKAGEIGRAHV